MMTDITTVQNLQSHLDFDSTTYRSRPRVMVAIFTSPSRSPGQTERDFIHIQAAFMKDPFWLPKADIKKVEVTSQEDFTEKFEDLVEWDTYGATWYDNFVFVFLVNFSKQDEAPGIRLGDDILTYKDIYRQLFFEHQSAEDTTPPTKRPDDRFFGKPKVFLFQSESEPSDVSTIQLPEEANNTVLLASSLISSNIDSPSPLIKDFVANLSNEFQHGKPFGRAIDDAVGALQDSYQKVGSIVGK